MSAQVKSFKGLNNVSDPVRLGLSWLVKADNVNITDSGAIEIRAGYAAPTVGSFSGAFSTQDYQRGYLVDAGALKTFEGATIATGIGSAQMYWTQINDQVFYNNGVDSGIINPDNTVIPWRWSVPNAPSIAIVTGGLDAGTYQVVCTFTLDDGRETGTSDPVEITLSAGQALSISGIPQGGKWTNIYIAPANATVYQLAGRTNSTALVWNAGQDQLGIELATDGIDPLPQTDFVHAWKSRIYAAQYFPQDDQTAIWFSQPLGFHLFDLKKDFFLVPGRVHMLSSVNEALLIGTEARIYAYTPEGLSQLADYGVIPGQHCDKDGSTLYFWTTRGLCSALPFTNLTERQVSVAPGVRAGGAIVRHGGQKRYVVSLQQGGAAFNQYP